MRWRVITVCWIERAMKWMHQEELCQVPWIGSRWCLRSDQVGERVALWLVLWFLSLYYTILSGSSSTSYMARLFQCFMMDSISAVQPDTKLYTCILTGNRYTFIGRR